MENFATVFYIKSDEIVFWHSKIEPAGSSMEEKAAP